MPLTFAHPAAVLPLRWAGLPLSALVVGSITPDLVYFARLAPRGHFGHTLAGLFLFCLPAGLALLWTFHRVLKRPLVELAPLAAQRRLAPHIGPSPFEQPLALAVGAVLLGAVTHDVWDAFTHASGWGVAAVPGLRHTLALGPLRGVPVYKLLQHGSTVLGLAALALAVAGWWRRAPTVEVRPRLDARGRAVHGGLLASLSLVAGTSYAAFVAAGSASPAPVFVGRFVVST